MFVAVIQKSGAVPAYSAGVDGESVDQSVTGGATIGCCCDKTSVVGATLGADDVEQMITDKLAPLMAKNVEAVDVKLAGLHADLQAQMVELAAKQQVMDAHQQHLTDRPVDLDRYAALVRSLLPQLFW